ncbi:uncharacterized protein YbaP (TraB family) [Saonia flava]|uniref:Uncharacterized protein YbaP (TraB family) n=1 Tax=Saonia flava TaxID=523696 RepID=A0A846QX32_9FLAO|nr:TraB/GumN family protein [Saonia flava]NJB72911.1 uncharacterized protein YbaP (TraB family) [Saonia flava]
MNKLITIIAFLLPFQSAIGQNTILWKVTDTINGKISMVVGTFHQYGNSFVDSIPEIQDALLQSELAIFESIDDSDSATKIINSRTQTNQISKHLKRKDFEKLKIISKNWKVNLYKLKPIELRWKLHQVFVETKCKTVKASDEWDHFDNYLIHKAKKNQIEIYGLESDSLQLSLIEEEYDYPEWKKEKKIIGYWIKKVMSKKLAKTDCSLAKKYRNFDLDYSFSEDCADDIILNKRNEDWMKTIPNFLETKNCFIAVGLFHLYKKCGLIQQLKSFGFKVEPIKI